MPNNIAESIQNAASIEATPALVDFWSNQFQGFVGQKFKYDGNSEVGSIDLMHHLTTDKKDIDHQLLQQTIAVLIRFLDALTPDLDYRSIKLSVENFAQFLSLTDTPAQIGADYIGGLIADFSYRASENLAHEKGAFLKFKELPKHVRAIEYEMWTDVSGEYKNGQEIATMFDDTSVASSTWSLVPRRNFAILDFPNDLDLWDKWRDSYGISRSDNSNFEDQGRIDAIEEINIADINLHNQTSENMLNEIGQGLNQDLDFSFDSEFSVPREVEKTAEKTMPKVADFPDLNQIKANLDQVNATDVDNMALASQIPTSPELDQFDFSDTDLYDTQNIAPATTQKHEIKVAQLEKQELYPDQSPQIPAQVLETATQTSEIAAPEIEEIVLGELVKVIEVDSPWEGKVFQVIDISGDQIRLAGQDQDLQNHIFSRAALQKQNLYEILENINESTFKPEIQVAAELPVAKAAALVINDQNQVLLARETMENGSTKLTLPSTTIKYNQIPEEAILKYLQTSLHTSETTQTRIIDEVGSVMVAANQSGSEDQNSIFNIFSITTNQNLEIPVENFEFVNLSEIPKELMLVKIALDKHNRKQKIIAEAVAHNLGEYQKEVQQTQVENMSQIRSQIQTELETDLESRLRVSLVPEIRAQILAEQSELLISPKNDQLDLNLPEYSQDMDRESGLYQPTQPNNPTESEQFESDQDKHAGLAAQKSSISVAASKIPSLAKFKVKLEHWIESDKFGNMALSLGYSSKGIESVSLADSSLGSDVKSTINLILHLFNHLLDNGLDLQELLGGLNLDYGDNEVPVNQLLSLILAAITAAPQKIGQINQEWLA